jgi:hypothetical protein
MEFMLYIFSQHPTSFGARFFPYINTTLCVHWDSDALPTAAIR